MVYTICVIGAGQVATHLSKALQKAGHTITQVYNHHIDKASALAKDLNCTATDNFKEIKPADIYLIAVKDDAIIETALQLEQLHGLIVHTSGTVALLSTQNTGVFYPLQSIKKDKEINLKEVPVCIEANNQESLEKLKNLATSISEKVQVINSADRLTLHLAAVLVNNFTNHLSVIAAGLLEKKNIPFDLLYPLIKETTEKIISTKPDSLKGLQTGPAKRKDFNTIQKHLELLDSNPEYKSVYQALTDSIIKSES